MLSRAKKTTVHGTPCFHSVLLKSVGKPQQCEVTERQRQQTLIRPVINPNCGLTRLCLLRFNDTGSVDRRTSNDFVYTEDEAFQNVCRTL